LTALGAPEHSKTRFFEDEVPPAPVRQLPHRLDNRLDGRIDHDVGADARADGKTAVDDIGEDHGVGAERFADRDC